VWSERHPRHANLGVHDSEATFSII
jgi:hypothetical protein